MLIKALKRLLAALSPIGHASTEQHQCHMKTVSQVSRLWFWLSCLWIVFKKTGLKCGLVKIHLISGVFVFFVFVFLFFCETDAQEAKYHCYSVLKYLLIFPQNLLSQCSGIGIVSVMGVVWDFAMISVKCSSSAAKKKTKMHTRDILFLITQTHSRTCEHLRLKTQGPTSGSKEVSLS